MEDDDLSEAIRPMDSFRCGEGTGTKMPKVKPPRQPCMVNISKDNLNESLDFLCEYRKFVYSEIEALERKIYSYKETKQSSRIDRLKNIHTIELVHKTIKYDDLLKLITDIEHQII